ncbi:hypothetical protein EE612_042560, partial [Oryza sativa]
TLGKVSPPPNRHAHPGSSPATVPLTPSPPPSAADADHRAPRSSPPPAAGFPHRLPSCYFIPIARRHLHSRRMLHRRSSPREPFTSADTDMRLCVDVGRQILGVTTDCG